MAAVATATQECDAGERRTERDGYVYARNGKTVLAVLRGSESRVPVSYDQIAPVMRHAIVAVEDRRFWAHRGIDIRGIARAAWSDVRSKAVVEGGSTITQQLVKNACRRTERSLGWKLREALLARQLEQQWKKKKILTAYLNTIYFGNGAYGIERAARVYFGHGAAKLTLPEAALLAGIPADPTRYDPVASPRAARARRDGVLRDLLEEGYILRSELRTARKAPLPRAEDVRLPGAAGQAQYFTNYVKQQLVDRYGSSKVFGGGLRVKTSIDLGLQRIGREAISQWLPDEDGPSAALVAIDPRTGAVLAMVGGRSFRKSQFNLAVQGERQPGLAFKPFVLAAALRQGIAPSTRFQSRPVTIPYDNRLWSVRNYESSYRGWIDLATATIASDNAVYAQLTNVVEPRHVAATAHAVGVTSPLDDYLAIGLGGEAVNALEMARAYSSFANGGRRVDGSIFGDRPRAILSVNDDDNRPLARQVLGPNENAILTSILRRVVTGGTGFRARLADGHEAAGKTGTTENYGDAWFVGYTPRLAVAVWVGYPNRLRPMLTEFEGGPVAGGTFPALIWKAFTERALRYVRAEPESFPAPEYMPVVASRLALRGEHWRLDNGYCRSTIEVVYFEGRAPKEADCKPNEVEVPRVVGEPVELAREVLEARPLRPLLIYKPAAPKQPLGVVLDQFPKGGTLSSYDEVKLVLAKPVHGVVPDVVGLTLRGARERLAAVRLRARADGATGRVVRQRPRAGVAAAPGMTVTLAVSPG